MSLGSRLFEEALKKVLSERESVDTREGKIPYCDCEALFNPYTKTFLHRPSCYIIKHLSERRERASPATLTKILKDKLDG